MSVVPSTMGSKSEDTREYNVVEAEVFLQVGETKYKSMKKSAPEAKQLLLHLKCLRQVQLSVHSICLNVSSF